MYTFRPHYPQVYNDDLINNFKAFGVPWFYMNFTSTIKTKYIMYEFKFVFKFSIV